MRKLSYKPLLLGFVDGLNRGMTSSNEVYEVEIFKMPMDRFDGLRHDRDALRADVERAKAKFDHFAKANKSRIAAG